MYQPVPIDTQKSHEDLQNEPSSDSEHLWSIVLAGGNGDRIRDLTQLWMGRHVPKQYCAFVGKKSMLQHTLLRADKLGRRDRQMVLIARGHESEAAPHLKGRDANSILVQPSNRDTLPGIFLPLTYVYARDAKATVVVYPSDHFIYPEENFVRGMEQAVRAAEELPRLVILIGAPASGLELEYGWIYPDKKVWESGGFSVFSVDWFLEKPSQIHAANALQHGGLWNTLIMAAKAETLWNLGWIYSPEIMQYFEQLSRAIGTLREKEMLEAIYRFMPARNFSKDLLEPSAKRVGVLRMENVLWSDWGRRERIIETLRRIGKQPNFLMAPAFNTNPVNKRDADLYAAS